MPGFIACLHRLLPCNRSNWAAALLMLIAYPPTNHASSDHSSSSALIGRTITIATGEFPPWAGSSLPQGGYVNHIVREAFASQGVKVEFIYQPWKRAYEEARQGKFDATSYWYESAERRKSMLFSEALINNRTVFFQRRENADIHWNTLSDLHSYRMSATLGFTYTDEFYRAIDNEVISPIMVPSDVQNLKLLMAERIDIFATDEMSGFYMAAQLSIDPRKLKVVERPLTTPDGYLLASKTNADSRLLINTFNRGLRAIKANGKYQAILNRVDNSSFYNPTPNTINQRTNHQPITPAAVQ
jgi:polar amino acid transport system substrate-binding protein